MRTNGRVRAWHVDEGWGVFDSEATPGGCWAHFSSVLGAGLRALHAGQSVSLEYEQAPQDGFAFRAVEVWPAGEEPHQESAEARGPSPAYRSSLTITMAEPDDPV